MLCTQVGIFALLHLAFQILIREGEAMAKKVTIQDNMKAILLLREVPLEIRDDTWRHQMWDLCQALFAIVDYNTFSYNDKSWCLEDDRRSVREVPSGET